MIIAAVSLVAWVPTALWGPQNPPTTLVSFARRVRPPGPGWSRYLETPAESLAPSVVRFATGLAVVFGGLFGIGAVVLGRTTTGWAWIAVAVVLAIASVVRAGSSGLR
ncbi:MAG: hypothetical protein GY769_23040 [bacterium]|nr:hypothetical protein [bacterium]